MNKSKKGKKDKKEDDPEYVSNVAKQMYELQLRAIQKKIDRRIKSANEWVEENPKIKQEIEAITDREEETIRDLKKILKEAVIEKLEKRQMVIDLQREIADDLASYHREILAREAAKFEKDSANRVAIAKLEADVDLVMKFKENREKLELELQNREREMDIKEERHKEKLELLEAKRKKNEEVIRIQTKQEIEKFAAKYGRQNTVRGDAFEENARLVKELDYLQEQIKEMKGEIPRVVQEIADLKTEIKEKNGDLNDILEQSMQPKQEDVLESYEISNSSDYWRFPPERE